MQKSCGKKGKLDRVVLVLSFLQAWYQNTPTARTTSILRRAPVIQTYMVDDDDRLKAVLAIQVFMYGIVNNTNPGKFTNTYHYKLFNSQS